MEAMPRPPVYPSDEELFDRDDPPFVPPWEQPRIRSRSARKRKAPSALEDARAGDARIVRIVRRGARAHARVDDTPQSPPDPIQQLLNSGVLNNTVAMSLNTLLQDNAANKDAVTCLKQENEDQGRQIERVERELINAKAAHDEAKRCADETKRYVDQLEKRLRDAAEVSGKRLPTTCSCCYDNLAFAIQRAKDDGVKAAIPAAWCAVSPSLDSQAHMICRECLNDGLQPFTTFDAKGCRWLEAPKGFTCPMGCCVFDVDALAAAGCSPQAVEQYKQCKARALQHAETLQREKRNEAAQDVANLHGKLEEAMRKAANEAVGCPNCHAPGWPGEGECLVLKCPCHGANDVVYEYCGFCFKVGRPIYEADSDMHDHVHHCPHNYNPPNAQGLKSYNLLDLNKHKEHVQRLSRDAALKAKQELFDSISTPAFEFGLGHDPMSPFPWDD